MKAAPKAPRAAAPPRAPSANSPVLVLDTGSPLSSLAIGIGGKCRGQRVFPLRRTSEELLPQLRALLAELGLAFADLGGAVALQGPGSFTGLRIGLATALGFHQALALPATAIGTLPVIAAWALGLSDGTDKEDAGPARPLPGKPGGEAAGTTGSTSSSFPGGTGGFTPPSVGSPPLRNGEGAGGEDFHAPGGSDCVNVAVDAMRGDFFAQAFHRGPAGEPLARGEARLHSAAELIEQPGLLAGLGLAELLEKAGIAPPAGRLAPEPPALAALAIPLLAALDWDPARLIQPIYFRPPAVTLPAG